MPQNQNPETNTNEPKLSLGEKLKAIPKETWFRAGCVVGGTAIGIGIGVYLARNAIVNIDVIEECAEGACSLAEEVVEAVV
jgi:hypothetical protein